MNERLAASESQAQQWQRAGQDAQARQHHAEHQRALAINAARVLAEAAAAPVAAPHGRVNQPKIPQPSTFDGSTGNRISEWLRELEKQHQYYGDYYAVESNKVAHAMFYVVPKVSTWFSAFQNEHAADGKTIDTFSSLSAEMLRHYQPISSAMSARANLDAGSQTGSVSSYNSFFYANMNNITDMSIADQIHRYTSGLKSYIQKDVLQLNSSSLMDAVNAAVKLEAYAQSSSKSSLRPPMPFRGSSSYSGTRNRAGPSSYSSSTPMEVSNIDFVGSNDSFDERAEHSSSNPSYLYQLEAQVRELQQQQRVQSSLNAMFGNKNGRDRQYGSSSSSSNSRAKSHTRVENVTKDDYNRCRLENRCLSCKEPGHVAKDCNKSFKSFQ